MIAYKQKIEKCSWNDRKIFRWVCYSRYWGCTLILLKFGDEYCTGAVRKIEIGHCTKQNTSVSRGWNWFLVFLSVLREPWHDLLNSCHEFFLTTVHPSTCSCMNFWLITDLFSFSDKVISWYYHKATLFWMNDTKNTAQLSTYPYLSLEWRCRLCLSFLLRACFMSAIVKVSKVIPRTRNCIQRAIANTE